VIEVALAGTRTRRIALRDIASARLAGSARLEPGRRSEMVRIDVRRIDWVGGFTQGQGFRKIQLRVYAPDALLDSVRARAPAAVR
jgi:hypothetical protein